MRCVRFGACPPPGGELWSVWLGRPALWASPSVLAIIGGPPCLQCPLGLRMTSGKVVARETAKRWGGAPGAVLG